MSEDIGQRVLEICRSARTAAAELARAGTEVRTQALLAMADSLRDHRHEVLTANAVDVELAHEEGVSAPMLKRLLITEAVFKTMCRRLISVAQMPDPVGAVLSETVNPEGLRVQRVSTPLGVIAMIYESRPNVTTDCAAACVRSGNAVILRGGSEAAHSNRAIVAALAQAQTGLPPAAVQLFDLPGHAAVGQLLRMNAYVDLLIPRGGRSLIEAVEAESRIPVMRHYDGICHQYIAADAQAELAAAVVVNSKCQRLEVCNSLETLLVDTAAAERVLPGLSAALVAEGVELRGCARARAVFADMQEAPEEDWRTEYLDAILSVRVVDGIEAAAAHIARYGSGHTDGIITESPELAERFVRLVDSASVMVNASTRLSGGEAYGLGAVVGIATGKLHARGPVGPAELTSYKWVARGQGHLRD